MEETRHTDAGNQKVSTPWWYWLVQVATGFPLWGLLLFLLLNWTVALPLYVVGVVLSLGQAYLVGRALQRPVRTGTDAMIGAHGRVLEVEGSRCLVKVRGELWRGVAEQPIARGSEVTVLRVEGITLVVAPAGSSQEV